MSSSDIEKTKHPLMYRGYEIQISYWDSDRCHEGLCMGPDLNRCKEMVDLSVDKRRMTYNQGSMRTFHGNHFNGKTSSLFIRMTDGLLIDYMDLIDLDEEGFALYFGEMKRGEFDTIARDQLTTDDRVA